VTGGIDVARAFDERAGRRRRPAPGAPARSIRPRYRRSPPGRRLCVYGGSQTWRVPLCGTTDRTSAGRLVVSSARGRPAKGAETEVGTGACAAKAAKGGTKKMVRAATSRRRSPPAPDKRRRDRLSTRAASACGASRALVSTTVPSTSSLRTASTMRRPSAARLPWGWGQRTGGSLSVGGRWSKHQFLDKFRIRNCETSRNLAQWTFGFGQLRNPASIWHDAVSRCSTPRPGPAPPPRGCPTRHRTPPVDRTSGTPPWR